jgi:hypothetical protein
MRYALIGAHLREEDLAGIVDVEPIELGHLFLSSIAFDPAEGLASPPVVRSAADLRGRLIDRETFIAIRYGTSVSGPAEAREKCGPLETSWLGLLEKYRGTVEMTLKVAGSRGPLRPDRRQFASGAAYLEALHRSRSALSLDEGFRCRVEGELGASAIRTKWNSRDDLAIEFTFLMLRTNMPGAREAGLKLKQEFPQIPFLLSGPWPLETFTNEQG